jgi:plastocyanin
VSGRHAALTIENQQTNPLEPHQFRPRTLTVACGTKATVTDNDNSQENSQGTRHTWSSSGHWDSGVLSYGDTYAYTFRSVGTFNFTCAFHSYMTGTVRVT